MTRKDYVDLAAALKETGKPIPIGDPKMDAVRDSVFNLCVNAVADVCSRDPKFDRARFVKAAGAQQT